jgi:hypothetical protein
MAHHPAVGFELYRPSADSDRLPHADTTKKASPGILAGERLSSDETHHLGISERRRMKIEIPGEELAQD